MHEHVTRMYFKNIWAELSYEFWTELSYKHGPSWHGPSFLWAELACAELIGFAFHRYNEIFILEMR